jgi:ubiquinone/menaquinone biosynthesis C-methylase UbiE
MKSKIQNQEKVWDAIACEWDEFKEIPSEFSKEFLSECSGRVLDLGSGSGRHLTKIKSGKMHLVDFSEEMLRLAEKKSLKLKIDAEFKKGNLWDIPYEDNYFDYAICISALHCISPEKHKESVDEIYRVLKPSGRALIGVWNFNSKRFRSKRKKGKEHMISWRDKGKRYYYLFELLEIHKLFEEAGFKIIKERNSEMMINFVVEKI